MGERPVGTYSLFPSYKMCEVRQFSTDNKNRLGNNQHPLYSK